MKGIRWKVKPMDTFQMVKFGKIPRQQLQYTPCKIHHWIEFDHLNYN